jgi:hypothetical protein
MKLPSTKSMILNGAAATVIGMAVVTQIKSFFKPNTIPSCPQRFEGASGVALGIERGGKLLQASDIQSASNGTDYGVLENLSVTRVQSGPAPNAIAITLAAGKGQADHPKTPGGVSFPWRPRALGENVETACLSFDVFLPADFNFNAVGTLPGFYGASVSEGADNEERFTANFSWGADGRAYMNVGMSTKTGWTLGYVSGEATLPRGRWVRIDQEIYLNTPKVADGWAMFWVDGELKASAENIMFRESGDNKIHGVKGDVFFGAPLQGRTHGSGQATKDERILMTPFELRWR